MRKTVGREGLGKNEELSFGHLSLRYLLNIQWSYQVSLGHSLEIWPGDTKVGTFSL